MRSYAAKRDINERPIIDYLERCGCSVVQINQGAIPDLIVGYSYMCNFLLEVKSDKGKLTEPQTVFFDTWKGQKDIVRNIRDVKDVLRRTMPVYVYECTECGNVVEIKQRISDPPIESCEKCGAPVNKIMQVPAIIYKTDGFTKRVKKES